MPSASPTRDWDKMMGLPPRTTTTTTHIVLCTVSWGFSASQLVLRKPLIRSIPMQSVTACDDNTILFSDLSKPAHSV